MAKRVRDNERQRGRNGHRGGDGYEPRAAAVARRLRDDLLQGRWKPGERIRQEAIAQECGTSRIPVRQALQQLQDEGLVTLTSHVGARVAQLDLGELDEIYLIREQLEPFALGQSVPHLSAADHDLLAEWMGEMEAAVNESSTWVQLDRQFHLTSYSAAPLPRLLSMVEGLWNSTQQYRLAYTRLPQRLELAHAEHRLLLEAILRRDPDDAARLSLMHIRRTRLTLDQHPEVFGRGPVPVGLRQGYQEEPDHHQGDAC